MVRFWGKILLPLIFACKLVVVKGNQCWASRYGMELMANNEVECSLRCRMHFSCVMYYFKDLDEFNSGSNTFSKNCILYNVYDHNMGAVSARKRNSKPFEGYDAKVCYRFPGPANCMASLADLKACSDNEAKCQTGIVYNHKQ